METIVYRKPDQHLLPPTSPASGQTGSGRSAETSAVAQKLEVLSAAYFYPLITEQEMVTWTHWLPTVRVFPRSRMRYSTLEITNLLSRLQAPEQVVEEFHWSWKMELFDAYEVRTPVRRDARDPLLIGRIGEERYRLALWGESLLPLEKITDLVQQSLAIRGHARTWQTRILLGSLFLGLAFGIWLGPTLLEVNTASAAVICALLSLFVVWIPTFIYTPQNRQHDFLDRYRC